MPDPRSIGCANHRLEFSYPKPDECSRTRLTAASHQGEPVLIENNKRANLAGARTVLGGLAAHSF
jgi:hypothetical protein